MFKVIRNLVIIVFVLAICFYITIFVLIGKGVQAISETTEGSFVQDVGAVVKIIENDYNKGYSDSTKNFNENLELSE